MIKGLKSSEGPNVGEIVGYHSGKKITQCQNNRMIETCDDAGGIDYIVFGSGRNTGVNGDTINSSINKSVCVNNEH